jgi:LPXTG-motif cell wall-anchored protein
MKKAILALALSVLLVAMFAMPAFAATFNAEFGAQFNTDVNSELGEWPDLGAKTTFEAGKAATITVDFDAPVAFGGNYAAINTNFPFDDDVVASITSFKVDGAAVSMGAAFLNAEGIDGGLRLTICNKWNSDIATQPLDVATLGEFTKLEITFIVGEAAGNGGGSNSAGKTNDSTMIGLALLALGLAAAGAFFLRRKIAA